MTEVLLSVCQASSLLLLKRTSVLSILKVNVESRLRLISFPVLSARLLLLSPTASSRIHDVGRVSDFKLRGSPGAEAPPVPAYRPLSSPSEHFLTLSASGGVEAFKCGSKLRLKN